MACELVLGRLMRVLFVISGVGRIRRESSSEIEMKGSWGVGVLASVAEQRLAVLRYNLNVVTGYDRIEVLLGQVK